MATEQEKTAMLTAIRTKIDIADRTGLKATAQSWRDLYVTIHDRPAAEIVMAGARSIEKHREG